MTTTLHPYLNFDGNTDEVMAFYGATFDAKVDILRSADGASPLNGDQKPLVIHATIKTPSLTLMASDTQPGQAVASGNQIHLSLNFTDPVEQTRVWERLAQGGTITMPLGEQYFGRFGMLVDKFGIHWMLHFNQEQA